MPYFEPSIISKVREIDLLTYLQNYEPENLIRFSRDTFCTKEHDSLKISNGMWYWFSQGFGGVNALDYLIKVKSKKFTEAVEILLDNIDNLKITPHKTVERTIPKNIMLPEKNDNNMNVKKYLLSRKIDKEIIDECISKGLIYEDKFHNAVFLGYDKFNKIRYAFIRGTSNIRYMKEAYGSHKAFSFRLDSYKESNVVHLFESAIDLLSYATINKNVYYNENLLSLAGVYQPQPNIEKSKLPLVLNYYLNQHPNIQEIHLHFDNDSVGRGATIALSYLLKDKYIVIDEPPKYGKDFNDYLRKKTIERRER